MLLGPAERVTSRWVVDLSGAVWVRAKSLQGRRTATSAHRQIRMSVTCRHRRHDSVATHTDAPASTAGRALQHAVQDESLTVIALPVVQQHCAEGQSGLSVASVCSMSIDSHASRRRATGSAIVARTI